MMMILVVVLVVVVVREATPRKHLGKGAYKSVMLILT